METTSNMETTSTWEFDGICNTQERQAAADRKWQQEMEAELLANRERQQELREQERRKRVEITAVRTGIAATALAVMGIYLIGQGFAGVGGVLLGFGGIAACVSAYGAGICREMDRK